MRHQQVIENFIKEGKGGRGTSLKATDDMLHSHVPAREFPWQTREGMDAPLAVRLQDGSLLANGAALSWPMSKHQRQVLSALEAAHASFGVVPFHSIVAAWTDGEKDDWDEAPIAISDLQKEVGIVV